MEGVKVVEMGVWVAGPAAGGILADWGADVIKIEPPGLGDPCRLFQTMLGGDLPFNPIFEMDNRSKRGIVLDLRQPEGRSLALELLDGADVFVTNIRMAALGRLGLDWEALQLRNPRLVYAAITGYGLEGDDADRAAYDIAAFWSRSAALFARERTGEGQLVSTSLLRQGLYTLSFDLALALRFGASPAVSDRRAMPNPAINCYQDSEGLWFWLVGLEGERHWPPLARAVGRPEWLEDERFKDPVLRAQNAVELIAELDRVFATRTRDEWGKAFDAETDMWWAPVQTIDEVVSDPQVRAAGGFVEVPDGPTTTTLPATPADFGGTPLEPRWMAPEPGQHTDEILAELGRTPREIADLRQRTVVA
jgi:crotonobetainyl-CoA:carnitine CoA-transferase CaiB-like acyl-CoA transferase